MPGRPPRDQGPRPVSTTSCCELPRVKPTAILRLTSLLLWWLSLRRVSHTMNASICGECRLVAAMCHAHSAPQTDFLCTGLDSVWSTLWSERWRDAEVKVLLQDPCCEFLP